MAQNRDQATDAVLAFVNARTSDESKRIVEERRDVLLTDATEEVLAALFTRYRDDERVTGILKQRQELLARCRQQGIDAAFTDYFRPSAATAGSEQVSLLQELSSLTALGEVPRRITACREVLAMTDRGEQPELWARFQVELGDSLQRNPQGDRAQNVEDAISHYEQALEVYSREDFPVQWSASHHNLANAYRERVRGDRAQNIEEAIYRHKLALEAYTREHSPVQWAGSQHSLANAYQERIREDRAENIEEAISLYELALEVRSREDFPVDWATTKTNLATVYRSRIRGEKAENIEEAISHCEQALEVYSRQEFPTQWAAAQHNLANAYKDRIRGDRAQNVEEAIYRHKLALEVYTRKEFPADWAMTQSNLAIAYKDRIRGDRAENLEDAIFHYEQALKVRTREASPVEWAMTQHNLANAYSNRIREDRAENVEEAIRCSGLALEIRTREALPVEWAGTQLNLAGEYLQRSRGEKAENLERAIRYLEQVLEVYTRPAFPLEWAGIQNNLGNAYWNRIRGEKAENAEEAIRHYQLALEVYTPSTLPQPCRDTAYFLGSLLYGASRYGAGRFADARRALTTAHEAVEALRGELVREGAKRELAEQNADLYARLVHCCLIEGDEKAAFEYAVAGKGRAFVDMLATARFDLSAAGADDPHLAEDLRRARELRQQIDNLLARLTGEGGYSPDGDGGEQRSVRSQMQGDLRSLQQQEASHWEEMSFRHPALTATQQAPTLSAEEGQKLSEELGAMLVELYRHAGGWCAFAVAPDSLRHVSLPAVNDDLLERMYRWLQRIESPTGRNKLSYELLRRLHRALIAPLQDHLLPGGRVVLAPFAELHLMPLGAALDQATGRYAAEEYTLTFTPNLAALRTTQQQGTSSTGQDDDGLLSVAYPDVPESEYHLPNVLPEAQAVARHFSRVTPLYEDAATPEAVLGSACGQDVVHLGCHGNFDSMNPRQSGLMLSGGWLTVQRIITELHLQQTRLATIGACLSGRVQVRRGEEHVAQERMIPGKLYGRPITIVSCSIVAFRLRLQMRVSQFQLEASQRAQSGGHGLVGQVPFVDPGKGYMFPLQRREVGELLFGDLLAPRL